MSVAASPAAVEGYATRRQSTASAHNPILLEKENKLFAISICFALVPSSTMLFGTTVDTRVPRDILACTSQSSLVMQPQPGDSHRSCFNPTYWRRKRSWSQFLHVFALVPSSALLQLLLQVYPEIPLRVPLSSFPKQARPSRKAPCNALNPNEEFEMLQRNFGNLHDHYNQGL